MDVVIIGGGIAGASAAYELAVLHNVVLLERESHPGYHTTGRSAAVYSETYGNHVIRRLTSAGREFFKSSTNEISEYSLLTPRGALFIGGVNQKPTLADKLDHAAGNSVEVEALTVKEILKLCPVLRENCIAGGVLEPNAMDIDVHSLLSGYLRLFKKKGGVIETSAEVEAIEKNGDKWEVSTRHNKYSTDIIVNAAGAWAENIAEMAGVPAIGLTPRRRTVILFDPSLHTKTDKWPLVIDVNEQFYFKPDAGKLLASPADATPTDACDVQPEELDIATAVDRIERVTTIEINKIDHKWAGLRTYAADDTPVVGFEPDNAGFFWLAGQGGYGIQTAPAISRCCASLIAGKTLPDDIIGLGVSEADLSPSRFR